MPYRRERMTEQWSTGQNPTELGQRMTEQWNTGEKRTVEREGDSPGHGADDARTKGGDVASKRQGLSLLHIHHQRQQPALLRLAVVDDTRRVTRRGGAVVVFQVHVRQDGVVGYCEQRQRQDV